MSGHTTERVHLSIPDARGLSERAMRGIGYEPEEACLLADHVMRENALEQRLYAGNGYWAWND